MKYPTLQEERKLWKKGYKAVVGLDEAGRGPLAGPVVAVAVMLKISNDKFLIQKQFQNFKFKKLFKNLKLKIKNLQPRDSKKLSPKAREKFYKILTTHPGIGWGIGRVSEKVIDKINILEATKLAMKRAVISLEKKLKKKRKKSPPVDFLLIDGNFKIDSKIPQKAIVKADEKVFSCAAASIIAKVYRDAVMKRYHKKYPRYNFAQHKGYPTKFHRAMLKKYGPCEIHRKTFKPVRQLKALDAKRTPQRVASVKRKTTAKS